MNLKEEYVELVYQYKDVISCLYSLGRDMD